MLERNALVLLCFTALLLAPTIAVPDEVSMDEYSTDDSGSDDELATMATDEVATMATEEMGAPQFLTVAPGYDVRRDAHENLLEMSGELFEHYINKNETEIWLLEFYNPHSRSSLAFAGKYRQVAKRLDGVMWCGRTDATSFRSISDYFEVSRYPTLYIFKDGHAVKYPGEMGVEAIVEFAKGGYKDHPMEKFHRVERTISRVHKARMLVRETSESLSKIVVRQPVPCAVLFGTGLGTGVVIGWIIGHLCMRSSKRATAAKKAA